jgi:hypothetical protein
MLDDYLVEKNQSSSLPERVQIFLTLSSWIGKINPMQPEMITSMPLKDPCLF